MLAAQVAGPMWLGPIHSPEFCAAVVESVDRDRENYTTHARIKGMVSVARDVSLRSDWDDARD